MTDEETVDDFIAKGNAKGLKDWELCHTVSDPALLEKINSFLKANGEFYGDNAHRPGA